MAFPITLEDAKNGISDSVNVTRANDYEDWYEITFDQTGTYTIYTDPLEGSAIGYYNHAIFELVDQYGNTLKEIDQLVTNFSNDTIADGQVNTFNITDSGTYFIKVYRNRRDQSVSYALKYQFSIILN
jgi:hypothetical protein